MKWLVVLLLCLLLQADGSNDRRKERRRWKDQEVMHSIKRNVVNCSVEFNVVARGHLDSPTGVRITLINPMKKDDAYFDELPVSLTLANRNISLHAAQRSFTAQQWGSIKRLRWAIPMNHPGQQRMACINMTLLAASEKVISFYETYKQTQRGFYVMHARKAFIHPSGAVGLSCGHFYGDEGCETRKVRYTEKWISRCRQGLRSHGADWEALFDAAHPKANALLAGCADLSMLGSTNGVDFPVSRHSKVFTIPALWDYNYHHFVVESLARLTHSLSLLQSHKDIMIHVRGFEAYDNNRKTDDVFMAAAAQMRADLLDLLGIDRTRLISGPVLADQVFVPRFTRCSYVLSNANEVIKLGKLLLTAVYRRLELDMKMLSKAWQSPAMRMAMQKDKLMVIQQRYNNVSLERAWSNETVNEVQAAFGKHFPRHRIQIISSLSRAERTLAEELYIYSQADVLVGLHGAGMTNMLVMPPNSLIVEFTGHFEDVSMPVCGYYGPLGAAFGHHHYIHSYDHAEGDTHAMDAAARAARLYAIIQSPAEYMDRVLRIPSSKREQSWQN